MRKNSLVYSMVNKSFLSMHLIKSTSCQAVFGICTVFNITPIVYLKVTTTGKIVKFTYILIKNIKNSEAYLISSKSSIYI